MTHRFSIRCMLLALLLSAAFILQGCGTNDGPTAPPAVNPITPLALDHAWPHADGGSSAFRYVARRGAVPPENRFANPADVPAVTLEQVAALLATPPPFTAQQEDTYGYVLTFQDSATTATGVRGQNLVPAVTAYPIPAPALAGSARAAAGVPADPPVFLGGGVWRQEPGRIALYTDLAADPTWVFLAGTLSDRTAWEARVMPGIANGVVMRARAYQSVIVDIAGVRRDDALDVHYLLDHGIETLTLPGGGLEYRRRFSYGRVVWARDAGPLYLYERRGLTAGSPPSPATSEETLLLEQATLPAAIAGRVAPPAAARR